VEDVKELKLEVEEEKDENEEALDSEDGEILADTDEAGEREAVCALVAGSGPAAVAPCGLPASSHCLIIMLAKMHGGTWLATAISSRRSPRW
jgi:hypothetical protein